MTKRVIGIFNTTQEALDAVRYVQGMQLHDTNVSILSLDGINRKEGDTGKDVGRDPIREGAGAGGLIGAIAGLTLGASLVAIPGIGPLLAAGPITAVLTGAAIGTVSGALIDWGIPEEQSQYYEYAIREGKILVGAETDELFIDPVMQSFKQYGAFHTQTHELYEV